MRFEALEIPIVSGLGLLCPMMNRNRAKSHCVSSDKPQQPLCCTHDAVLDCANGHQKEIQEEVNEFKKDCRSEVTGEAAAKAKSR